MNLNATLIAQLIVFLILLYFFVRHIWPPLAKVLDERADKIAEGLAAAERGKNDFEQAEKKVTEILAEGHAKVTELVSNAEKRAAQIVDEAKNQATVEAERITSQAKMDIDQEINRARETLREQVSVLAVKGAEAILRREVDQKQHEKMLNSLKQEL